MSVFKINKTDNYTVMSNYHLRDKNLSYKAKGLLSFMLSLPEDWDYSISGLVQVSREGEDAIKSILKELQKYNYLKINKQKNDKGLFEYEYVIYEYPEGDNPGVDNPGVDVPELENPGQINTNNKIKTNNTTVVDKDQKNLIELVEENFGRTLSPLEYEEIQTWEDNELTRFAIKQAILNDVRRVKYISSILYEYQKNNITSVIQAQEREKQFKQQKTNKKYTYSRPKEESFDEMFDNLELKLKEGKL